jgi:cystathionine beta-lyase
MSASEDFDRVIDRRGTASSKWDLLGKLFGSEDLLSLWVADMDWPSPDAVVEAMRRRLDHPLFGYTHATAPVIEAIVGRLDRRFGWRVRPEWVVITKGVVNALYGLIRAFTHPGDEVVVQPPVYYPFYHAVQNCGCRPLENHLVLDGGRYRIDLDGLEASLRGSTSFPSRTPRARMLLLSSPHNPVARVWAPEELRRLAEICAARDCMLVSDEIHADLVLDGFRHTVTATLDPRIEQGTITLMSASKTFNLAGLDTSFAVIPNDGWRRTFLARQEGHGANIFGLVALEAAFRHGDDYLEELLRRINANMAFFIDDIERRVPPLTVIRPEGTYLAWVDARGLGLAPRDLQAFIRRKARLALDDGFAFGPGGDGFLRVNVACPRPILAEAIDRLERAVAGLDRA